MTSKCLPEDFGCGLKTSSPQLWIDQDAIVECNTSGDRCMKFHEIYMHRTSEHNLSYHSTWLGNNITSSLCEGEVLIRIDVINTLLSVLLQELQFRLPLPNIVIANTQIIFYIMCRCIKVNHVHDNECHSFSLNFLEVSHNTCSQQLVVSNLPLRLQK